MRSRPYQIHFRLSEEEKERLDRKVAEAGMTRQEYLREASLGMPVTNMDGLKALLPEMKRQGNNLNQLARRMNGRFPVAEDELEKTLLEVRETWRLLRREIQRHR